MALCRGCPLDMSPGQVPKHSVLSAKAGPGELQTSQPKVGLLCKVLSFSGLLDLDDTSNTSSSQVVTFLPQWVAARLFLEPQHGVQTLAGERVFGWTQVRRSAMVVGAGPHCPMVLLG